MNIVKLLQPLLLVALLIAVPLIVSCGGAQVTATPPPTTSTLLTTTTTTTTALPTTTATQPPTTTTTTTIPTTTTQTYSTTTALTTTTASTTTQQTGSFEVLINIDGLSPSIITIPVCSTVTWNNRCDEPRAISINSYDSSGEIMPGQSWSYTFTQAGRFEYNESLSNTMGVWNGTVIVE